MKTKLFRKLHVNIFHEYIPKFQIYIFFLFFLFFFIFAFMWNKAIFNSKRNLNILPSILSLSLSLSLSLPLSLSHWSCSPHSFNRHWNTLLSMLLYTKNKCSCNKSRYRLVWLVLFRPFSFPLDRLTAHEKKKDRRRSDIFIFCPTYLFYRRNDRASR